MALPTSLTMQTESRMRPRHGPPCRRWTRLRNRGFARAFAPTRQPGHRSCREAAPVPLAFKALRLTPCVQGALKSRFVVLAFAGQRGEAGDGPEVLLHVAAGH